MCVQNLVLPQSMQCARREHVQCIYLTPRGCLPHVVAQAKHHCCHHMSQKWEHQDHVLHAACCKESARTVWYALGMQTDPQLRAALAARFSSQAESGHSSTTNGGLPPEGPSLEERRAYQKRAGEDSSSEPPAPIRVDVSDSGAIHAFLSASQSNYEVSLSLHLTQVGISCISSPVEE